MYPIEEYPNRAGLGCGTVIFLGVLLLALFSGIGTRIDVSYAPAGNIMVGEPVAAAQTRCNFDWVSVDGVVVTIYVAAIFADGLMPGDVILRINGQQSAALLSSMAAGYPGLSQEEANNAALQDLLHADAGAPITLMVMHNSDKPYEFVVTSGCTGPGPEMSQLDTSN